MRSTISLSVLFLGTALSACAVMPIAEMGALKCGDTKDTVYEIPTAGKPARVNIQFKMACEGAEKGVELKIENHPWGGVGMTMARTIGDKAPDYEFIPCAETPELKAKWNELNNFRFFADKGLVIQDINNVNIAMRIPQDYALRYYVLNSTKNFCSAPSK